MINLVLILENHRQSYIKPVIFCMGNMFMVYLWIFIDYLVYPSIQINRIRIDSLIPMAETIFLNCNTDIVRFCLDCYDIIFYSKRHTIQTLFTPGNIALTKYRRDSYADSMSLCLQKDLSINSYLHKLWLIQMSSDKFHMEHD